MEKTHGLYNKILNLAPSKSEMRKVAILEAVLDAISFGGIHNITSQEIGKRAKMRRSHVVYYFKNRDEMIDAAIDYAIAVAQNTTIAFMKDAKDPKGLLTSYIESNFNWLKEYPRNGAVLQLLFYLSSSQSSYRKKMQQVTDSGEERVASILRSGKVRKGKGQTAVMRCARNIRNVLIGNMTMVACLGETVDSKAIEQDTVKCVQTLVEEIWV